MNKNTRLLTTISVCFMLILLATFVLTYTEIINLRSVNEIEFSPTVEYVANTVMFTINLFFLCAISLKRVNVNTWLYIILCVTCCAIVPLVIAVPQIVLSAVVPTFWMICLIKKFHSTEFRKYILRYCAVSIIIMAYQQVSGYIKLYGFGLNYYECNVATMFIYSIDLYLVYILMYCVVRVDARENILRLLQFLESYRREVLNLLSNNKNEEDVSDLTVRQRRVFFAISWIYVIVQPIVILGSNIFVNKMFHFLGSWYIGAAELIISWISLEMFRLVIGKTLHKESPAMCNAISFVVFFIISRFSMPLNISLFFNISISAVIAFVIHLYVIKQDRLDELEAYKSDHDAFDPRTCTVEVLLERCRKKGVRPRDYDFCVAAFHHGLTDKELAGRFHYELQSVKNKKSRMNKLLNKQ